MEVVNENDVLAVVAVRLCDGIGCATEPWSREGGRDDTPWWYLVVTCHKELALVTAHKETILSTRPGGFSGGGGGS